MALLIEHAASQVDHKEDVVALMLSVFVQTPSVSTHVESELPISALSGVAKPRPDKSSTRVTDRLPGGENELSQGRKREGR